MNGRQRFRRLGATALASATSAGLRYAYRETFNDAADGDIAGTPLTRTCFPGPGTISLKDRNAGDTAEGTNLSFASGKLAIAAGVSAWNRVGFHSVGSFARSAGKILALKYTHASTGGIMLGATTAASEDFSGYNSSGLYVLTNTLYARYTSAGNSPAIATLTGSTEYDLATVLQATGRFIFCRTAGGAWKLLWWDGTGLGGISTTPLYLGATEFDTGATKYDDVRSPIKTFSVPALQDVTSPPVDTEYAGSADGVFDMTLTWGTGQTNGFTFRTPTGDSSGWHVYAHTDATLKLDKVGGVSAGNKLTSGAGAFVNGRTETIRVICEGTTIAVYLYDSLATNPWTKVGEVSTSASSSEYDANTYLRTDDGADATASKFIAYSRTPGLFSF